MKDKIKILENLLLKLKMETYINKKSSRIYNDEIDTLEEMIKILKNKELKGDKYREYKKS